MLYKWYNKISFYKVMIFMNEYAIAIKELRTKMMLSQQEFAKVLGVSFASINRWENGAHEPTIKTKRKLRALFKEYDVKIY